MLPTLVFVCANELSKHNPRRYASGQIRFLSSPWKAVGLGRPGARHVARREGRRDWAFSNESRTDIKLGSIHSTTQLFLLNFISRAGITLVVLSLSKLTNTHPPTHWPHQRCCCWWWCCCFIYLLYKRCFGSSVKIMSFLSKSILYFKRLSHYFRSTIFQMKQVEAKNPIFWSFLQKERAGTQNC